MKRKLVLAILSLLFTQACSVNGNVVDLTQSITLMNSAYMAQITSGGSQQKTSGGYTISSSVGIPMASVKQTTNGGYTVFSNFQGGMNSDTYTTQYH